MIQDRTLLQALDTARHVSGAETSGIVSSVVGLRFDVAGLSAALGDAVVVPALGLQGEVVAINDGSVTCMPYGELRGLRVGDRVMCEGHTSSIAVGEALLGRVIDAMGNPIDGKGPLVLESQVPAQPTAPHPLARPLVRDRLNLGVRAWDAFAAAGRGQRVGVFAGSGVGKSTLMGMIARNSQADVNVVALIGERGREVREFIETDLGEEGLKRSVVIVATSDQPALVRVRAAFAATAIAQWFRDKDLDVVLMMDSLTRVCHAQREIGLSAGEPPTTRGYPPSTFALMPKLLEAAGTAEVGSITGIYTVLVDGDDHNEPVSDAARSILDGHITLDRKLAHAGHYPAINVLQSASRVQSVVATRDHIKLATHLRKLLAAWEEAKDLIEIGAYAPGSNSVVDEAVSKRAALEMFLQQDVEDAAAWERTYAALELLAGSEL
jgi:flagellum-specific ATP synthase